MKYQNINAFRILSICLTILFLGLMSASITYAETYKSNVVSTNYQYQAWGQYPVINLFGEKYVPLFTTTDPIWKCYVDTIAPIVCDTNNIYTFQTGDKINLGFGYSLLDKQNDFLGKKAWFELDHYGQYVDDYILSTDTIQHQTWTSVSPMWIHPNVANMKVHLKQVMPGGSDGNGIVQIDSIWLISLSDSEYLHIGDSQFGSYILTAINYGVDTSNLGSLVFNSPSPPVLPIVVGFSASPTTGTAPLTVKFTDQSTGTPIHWDWDFGDGTTSTAQNPTHTYAGTGIYTVTLSVYNNIDYRSYKLSKSNYITVTNALRPPVAGFTSTPTKGTAPLVVTFTDTSTGAPTSWVWKFGDGTTSTVENPKHTYSKAGTYSVSLMVTNSAGSNSIVKSNYVDVSAPKPPVATFSATPTSGKAALTVTFTDKSTGSPTSWLWNFGDKTTSTVRNPTHKYTKAGKYTVSLTVKNAAGSNTKKISNYITVK